MLVAGTHRGVASRSHGQLPFFSCRELVAPGRDLSFRGRMLAFRSPRRDEVALKSGARLSSLLPRLLHNAWIYAVHRTESCRTSQLRPATHCLQQRRLAQDGVPGSGFSYGALLLDQRSAARAPAAFTLELFLEVAHTHVECRCNRQRPMHIGVLARAAERTGFTLDEAHAVLLEAERAVCLIGAPTRLLQSDAQLIDVPICLDRTAFLTPTNGTRLISITKGSGEIHCKPSCVRDDHY